MANQQQKPKKENTEDLQKRTGRDEPEISRNSDEEFEGSSGSMSGARQSQNSYDRNRDVETERESTERWGTTGIKIEREH